MLRKKQSFFCSGICWPLPRLWFIEYQKISLLSKCPFFKAILSVGRKNERRASSAPLSTTPGEKCVPSPGALCNTSHSSRDAQRYRSGCHIQWKFSQCSWAMSNIHTTSIIVGHQPQIHPLGHNQQLWLLFSLSYTGLLWYLFTTLAVYHIRGELLTANYCIKVQVERCTNCLVIAIKALVCKQGTFQIICILSGDTWSITRSAKKRLLIQS